MIGNIFVGYPCVYGDRSCTTNDFAYDYLRKDRFNISSQIEKFEISVQ